LAEQLLRLTEDGHDVLPRSAAHMARGVTAYFRGEFLVAQEQLQQGLALFDPRQHNSPAVLAYGPHPGMIALFYLPLVLWMRGYPDRALQVSEEGLSVARQLSHPHSQAFASIPVTTLRQFRLEAQATREHAEAGMVLCREHGFGVYALMDAMLHGWSLAALGQGEAGVAELRQSLLSYQVAGAGLAKSYFLTLLAEAYGRRGQPHEGLTILTEAFAVGQENDEHVWEAEMYRQKGELLLQQGRRRE
jgi:predicted ATPase